MSIQAEIDLWQELREGISMPQSANLKRLCELLDWAIAQLSENQQLEVAGRAIEQMAEIYALRFNSLMGAWEDANSFLEEMLPVLDLEALEVWIRQSMSVDLDVLIDKPMSHRNRERQAPESADSIVAIVEPEAILQMVEKIEAEEHSQMIRQLAGEENPARWSAAITEWLCENSPQSSILMKDLLRRLRMPLVEVWLGLLLGDFCLEQVGDFYTDEILVRILP